MRNAHRIWPVVLAALLLSACSNCLPSGSSQSSAGSQAGLLTGADPSQSDPALKALMDH